MNSEKKIENDFKPRTWLLIALIIIGLGITVVLVNKLVEERNRKLTEEKELLNNISSNALDSIKEQYDNMKEIEGKYEDSFNKSTFNSKFEMYSGTENGSFVINLIDEVITNNRKNNDHIITVVNGNINSSDPEEIRKIKVNITDNFAKYEVILDYDENGYVNKITIE